MSPRFGVSDRKWNVIFRSSSSSVDVVVVVVMVVATLADTVGLGCRNNRCLNDLLSSPGLGDSSTSKLEVGGDLGGF